MVQRSAVGKDDDLRLSRGGGVGSIFYSALDPGLLIASAHQQQQHQGSRNVNDRKGKGKASDLVIANKLARKEQLHQGRQQQQGASKNGSIRIAAALGFSTESPRLKQHHNYHQRQVNLPQDRQEGEQATTGSNELSNSTIESFNTTTRASVREVKKVLIAAGAGASSASPPSPPPPPAPQVYDILSAEKRRDANREVLAREKRLREEIGRRTSYSSSTKERRAKRRRKEEGEEHVGKPSRTMTKEGMSANNDTFSGSKGDVAFQGQPPAPSDPADALWNDIWGRWDQTMNSELLADAAVVSKPSCGSHQPTTTTKTTTIFAEGVGSEDFLSSSQVSLQSDNGQFQSQFSFYHFPSQDSYSEYDDDNDEDEEKDYDSRNGPTLENISRSRIDARLLLEDGDGYDENKGDDGNYYDDNDEYNTMPQAQTQAAEVEQQEKEARRKRQIERICRESDEDMRPVGHVVFAGRKECRRYFAPAWDGFRFAKEPPGRADLDAWCLAQGIEDQGPLYDYEGELEKVPHWQDDHQKCSTSCNINWILFGGDV